MKKTFVAFLIGLSLFTVGCSCSKKGEETKTPEQLAEELHLNTSTGIISEKTIDNIKFSNISLLIEEGISKFSCNIQNTTEQAKVLGVVEFIFKDEKGKVLYSQKYPIDVLAKGETISISFTSDINLSDAITLEYAIKSE